MQLNLQSQMLDVFAAFRLLIPIIMDLLVVKSELEGYSQKENFF